MLRECTAADLDPSRPAAEQRWCVLDKDGSKVLGRFADKDKAEGFLRDVDGHVSKGLVDFLKAIVPGSARFASPLADPSPDWRVEVQKADRTGTVLVLSPPDAAAITPRELAQRAIALDGADFLIEYPDSPEARWHLAKAGRLFAADVEGGAGRLFVASFPIPDAPGLRWLGPPDPTGTADAGERSRIAKAVSRAESGPTRLAKADEEGYVLLVVLEPLTKDNPDAQGDWYTAGEIRKAMFRYMKEKRNVGWMHKQLVNGEIHIVENYQTIAPIQIQKADGTSEDITTGTWMIGLLMDPTGPHFRAFKNGDLTGASIGGDGIRVPDRS